MQQLSTRHLLGIKGINEQDIQLIFETADNFKDVINRPIKKVPALRGRTVLNLFYESSTRTRSSFELAAKRLSADVVNFAAGGSAGEKGEALVLRTAVQHRSADPEALVDLLFERMGTVRSSIPADDRTAVVLAGVR